MLGFLILALLVVIAGVAGLLTLIGLIGRRVQIAPACRRCRFDLTGDPRTATSDFPITCPECGVGIRSQAQIRYTQRRRLPRLTIAGVIIGVVSVISAGGLLVTTGGSLDLIKLASNNRLISMTDSGDYMAQRELSVRAADGQLSDANWTRVSELVRSAFSDGNKNDQANWSTFYMPVVERGDIPAREARDLAESFFSSVSLEVPPDLSNGDPLPFVVQATMSSDVQRIDPNFDVYSLEPWVNTIRLNGETIYQGQGELLPLPETDADYRAGREVIDWVWEGEDFLPTLSGIRSGENTLEVTVGISASDPWAEFGLVGALLDDGSNVGPIERTIETVWVAGAVEPPVVAPAAPFLSRFVEVSLSKACSCGTSPGVRLNYSSAEPEGFVDVHGQARDPDNAAAFFDVYVECQGERWFVGSTRADSSDRQVEVLIDAEMALSIEEAGGATVVLESAPWLGRRYYSRPQMVVDGDPEAVWLTFEDEDDTNQDG